MHRRLALGLLIVVTAALPVLGCASTGDAVPPRVRLADMKFVRSGLFVQQIGLDLLVGNPNNFDIAIEGLTFELEINGRAFADGFSNQALTIPRLSEATVPVTASTTLLDLVQQALILGDKGDLSYRISGVTYLGGLHKRSLPYERAGKLRLLPEREGQDTEGQDTLVPL
jgi:LEA14-like dessication related protein